MAADSGSQKQFFRVGELAESGSLGPDNVDFEILNLTYRLSNFGDHAKYGWNWGVQATILQDGEEKPFVEFYSIFCDPRNYVVGPSDGDPIDMPEGMLDGEGNKAKWQIPSLEGLDKAQLQEVLDELSGPVLHFYGSADEYGKLKDKSRIGPAKSSSWGMFLSECEKSEMPKALVAKIMLDLSAGHGVKGHGSRLTVKDQKGEVKKRKSADGTKEYDQTTFCLVNYFSGGYVSAADTKATGKSAASKAAAKPVAASATSAEPTGAAATPTAALIYSIATDYLLSRPNQSAPRKDFLLHIYGHPDVKAEVKTRAAVQGWFNPPNEKNIALAENPWTIDLETGVVDLKV